MTRAHVPFGEDFLPHLLDSFHAEALLQKLGELLFSHRYSALCRASDVLACLQPQKTRAKFGYEAQLGIHLRCHLFQAFDE